MAAKKKRSTNANEVYDDRLDEDEDWVEVKDKPVRLDEPAPARAAGREPEPEKEPSPLDLLHDYYDNLGDPMHPQERAVLIKEAADRYAEEHACAPLNYRGELTDLMLLAGIVPSAENVGALAHEVGFTGNPGDRDAVKQHVMPAVLSRLHIAFGPQT